MDKAKTQSDMHLITNIMTIKPIYRSKGAVDFSGKKLYAQLLH
jgi:hypothetical protein